MMYTVYFRNGDSLDIKADYFDWSKSVELVTFTNGLITVAILNADEIIGVVKKT